MSWTSILKPTGTNYTNVNPIGREQYDQADIAYDDSSVFYDGFNPSQWSTVAKPTIQGLGGLMWSEMTMSWDDADEAWSSSGGWQKISKPI